MNPGPRIIEAIPLERLWTDAGPLWAARQRNLLPNELVQDMAANPATVRQFAVAEVGRPLKWFSMRDPWMTWWHDARSRLAAWDDANCGRFDGGYCYVASEWPLPKGRSRGEPEVVILLERYDRHAAAPRDKTDADPAHATPRTDDELTQSDREFHLELYRYAVRRYQPIIEQRSGVSLGRIQVKPMSELSTDVARSVGPFTVPGLPGEWLAASRRLRTADIVGHWNAWTQGVYRRNAIYVSFTFGVGDHEDSTIRLVVHELAHRLWEKLGGRFSPGWWRRSHWLARHTLAVEGYATYIERIWLIDTYPPSLRKRLSREPMAPASVYTHGLRAVQKTVAKHGPDTLMRFPREWRKLIEFGPDRH